MVTKKRDPSIPLIRLLLVDDHPMVREGLRAVLSPLRGFEVVGEAADGKGAVAEYERLRPDITLMDLRMPVMDGQMAMVALRKLDPQAKIIVLTSYDKRVDVEVALTSGAQGFLLKSTSAEETMATIRRVHEKPPGVLDPEMLKGVAPPTGTQPLSVREIQVLKMVARGCGNRQIAADLGMAIATVKFHLDHIRGKLGAKDRAESVMIAMRDGIIEL